MAEASINAEVGMDGKRDKGNINWADLPHTQMKREGESGLICLTQMEMGMGMG
jgi:hypothetical protein